MLALQRSVGNAAVARMLADERHSHSSTCGHGDAGASLPVQRRMRAPEREPEDETQALDLVKEVTQSRGKQFAGSELRELEAWHGGADLSGVQVHDDAKAQRAAAGIGARAYTAGEHIVLGKGGHDIKTKRHETAHVLQQRQGAVSGASVGNGMTMSSEGDPHERAATAAETTQAAPVPVQSAPRRKGDPQEEEQ
ncbi:DUF4157 domain-containing protein [Streptomyces sp. NPDC056987]|uniref:eCIS core domain-containing protein n=1 Tax=Streptomyces sp. NPDC056987 TaxID=3345988 RepID=UPI00362BED82